MQQALTRLFNWYNDLFLCLKTAGDTVTYFQNLKKGEFGYGFQPHC
jgi:hypothetical protein